MAVMDLFQFALIYWAGGFGCCKNVRIIWGHQLQFRENLVAPGSIWIFQYRAVNGSWYFNMFSWRISIATQENEPTSFRQISNITIA